MSEVPATTSNPYASVNPYGTDTVNAAQNAEKSAEKSKDVDQKSQFMSVLMAQLENQDPTDPMDTNEMTNQMLSYSQLEQDMEANAQLESMNNSLLANNNFLAVSYLGTDMELNSPQAPVQNGTARWAYDVGAGASSTQISVTDQNGNLVYQAAGETDPGRHGLTLTQEDMAGVTEDSVLTLSVSSLDSTGEPVSGAVSSFVNVEMVDTTGSSPVYQAGNLTFGDSNILKFYSSDAVAA